MFMPRIVHYTGLNAHTRLRTGSIPAPSRDKNNYAWLSAEPKRTPWLLPRGLTSAQDAKLSGQLSLEPSGSFSKARPSDLDRVDAKK